MGKGSHACLVPTCTKHYMGTLSYFIYSKIQGLFDKHKELAKAEDLKGKWLYAYKSYAY